MDKKFVTAVVVCVMALVGVAAGTFAYGEKSQPSSNKVVVKKEVKKEIEEARELLSENQTTLGEEATEGDRVADYDPVEQMEAGETKKVISAGNVVEANTQRNSEEEKEMYGLSSEAAARIKTLKFDNKSEILWPVKGSILIPYDMENTVYYKTLNEYKTSPGIVIASEKGQKVVAASDGVITSFCEDEELGMCINQAVGNDFIATYGQVVNPQVEVGQFVEAGQTIAYVNEPTEYFSKEGYNLYFAIARNGKTKNPMNYINYED